MKNLLTKTLFIPLLLSAAMPFDVQAGGAEALKQAAVAAASVAAVPVVAQEGQGAIPIEVVVLAAAVPVVIVTVMMGATGNVNDAVAAGERVMGVMGEKMKIAAVTMATAGMMLVLRKIWQ